ncbi:MAG TPA: DUF4058 family protein [Pirellulaceae bacterium]|nr:DUF4058 family protein [Pirellulaceae bacterium]
MPIHDWSKVYAGLFHHFHQRWIQSLCDALNDSGLPEGYYALSEQVTSGPIPDVVTLQHRPETTAAESNGGGVAVLTTPPKTRFVVAAEPELYAAKASRVVVRHSMGKVVAVIEIVSPENKESIHALRSFVDKGVDFLRQGINLLIVDLFPPTKRDPEGIHKALWDEIREEPFSLPKDKPLTLVAYDAGPPITAYVEAVAVGDELSSMALFLSPGEHVSVPLAASYETTWNVCPAPLKEAVQGA